MCFHAYMLGTCASAWQAQCHVNAVKQESSDEESSDDDVFLGPPKKVQKQGSGATAGTSSKPKLASGTGSKASTAVPARDRPASGSVRPSSAGGSKAAGSSRPASGGANKSAGASRPSSGDCGKAAGERPAAKPSRPLVASTTKVCSTTYKLAPGLDMLHESAELVPLLRRLWSLQDVDHDAAASAA